MSKKASRILVYILNTVIIVINALISIIQNESKVDPEIAFHRTESAIVREYARG